MAATQSDGVSAPLDFLPLCFHTCQGERAAPPEDEATHGAHEVQSKRAREAEADAVGDLTAEVRENGAGPLAPPNARDPAGR
jgi:hypothetical protein